MSISTTRGVFLEKRDPQRYFVYPEQDMRAMVRQKSVQNFSDSLRKLKIIISDIFICVGVTLLLLLRTRLNAGFQKYIVFGVAGIMIFGLTYLLSQQLFQKLIDGIGFNFMGQSFSINMLHI